jgi:hypothetical protein
MKPFNRFYLFFTIVLFATTHASSQDYAINQRGDTLRGALKVFNFGQDKRLQVVDAQRKKTNLSVTQVRSFKKDNEIFHPVKGPGGYTFMKLIKEGYLSLYGFQVENQMTYDGLFLTKKDGTSLEVPNLNFKKAVTKFLADCPSTAEKVENGTLGKRELTILVDDYNGCIAGNTVNHTAAVRNVEAQKTQAQPWEVLEEKVKASSNFDGKADALEMIAEVKNKISRGEKIPKFLTEGLRNSLKDAGVNEELATALKEID